MSNGTNVTGLTFSMSSGKNKDDKPFLRTHFDFKGNISLDEATDLIKEVKRVISETSHINQIRDEPSSENEASEDESSSSDDDLMSLPELVDSNNNDIHYPIQGNAMPLNHIQDNPDVIKRAFENNGSILVKPSSPINRNGYLLNFYRIIFPSASFPFKKMTFTTENVPVIFQNYGYPICSCPAYYFKSYKHRQSGNNSLSTGMCKHIHEALTAIGLNSSIINWNERPDVLPFLMKQDGILEYQWVQLPQSTVHVS